MFTNCHASIMMSIISQYLEAILEIATFKTYMQYVGVVALVLKEKRRNVFSIGSDHHRPLRPPPSPSDHHPPPQTTTQPFRPPPTPQTSTHPLRPPSSPSYLHPPSQTTTHPLRPPPTPQTTTHPLRPLPTSSIRGVGHNITLILTVKKHSFVPQNMVTTKPPSTNT